VGLRTIKNSVLLMFSWKSKKLYEKMFQNILEELQLTQVEVDVLLFLQNNKPFDTAKDIVEYRSISKSMVSKSVDSLLARGYLSYEIDMKDKRCIHLKIEAAAEPAVKKLLSIQKSFIEVLYGDFSRDELEIFEKGLNKIDRNISNALKNK
jgi:DNA-binding MarR family transcriptional regulator